MRYTLGTAATETGKSKSTILRAIRDGRLSYREKNSAGYQIDPAELFRVFPRNMPGNVSANDAGHQAERDGTALRSRIAELEARLELVGKRADELKDHAEQWKQEAAHWRQQATALLEGKRGKRGWFGRWKRD